jgi:uncharacterized damage-inducible protein DinB
MLADAICEMYRYTNWANERILDRASLLSPEQFLTPDDTPMGSIRNTLVHMISWQRRWLSWWSGDSPTLDDARLLALDPADYPDVETVRAEWRALHEQTETFLAQLTDAKLDEICTGKSTDGRDWHIPLWKLMMQVANHGTQHRSEIAMKLTNFGHSPGGLDFYFYVLETDETAVA